MTEALEKEYPDLKTAGVLIHDFKLAIPKEEYQKKILKCSQEIREQYPSYIRAETIKEEPLCSYARFYKHFKKTYPVLLQLESFLLKGKEIPDNGPLIQSMFLMELKNKILTAGHDFDQLSYKKHCSDFAKQDEKDCFKSLCVELAKGGEKMLGIGERELILSEKDIYLQEEEGILSSVLAGPDHRTRITEKTKEVLYFAYGFETDGHKGLVEKHIIELKDFILELSPESSITMLS